MGANQKTDFAESKLDASPLTKSALVARWSAPTGARLSFSPAAIARQRLATLQSFDRLKDRGAAKAAAMVGASIPTLWRWRKQFVARGLTGLKPKPAKGGRRSPFENVRLSAPAAREVEKLIVQTGSAAAGWMQFASSPLCPPLVARHIIQTGKAPARFADVGRVQPVAGRCFVSVDARRLLIRLPCQGTFLAAQALPVNLKLYKPKAIR